MPKDESAPHFTAVLEPLAQKYEATVPQIALAWQLHRSPVILPIPGTTSVEHLKENLRAAAIRLTSEEVAEYEARAVRELGAECARWLATGERL